MRRIRTGAALIAAVAVCVMASCSGKSGEDGTAKQAGGPAIPVTAAVVESRQVPVEIRTFGTVQAHASVQVRAEVGGTLSRIHIRKGQNVRRGDLLFTIDPRSYQAALDQARATLVRDRALEENALVSARRSAELYRSGYISKSDDDKAQTDARALTATVRADEAAVANARLQVERCSIESPIGGKAGDILVSEGALIKANDVPLVTINQIHPIEVFFSIPQAELSTVRARMARERLPVRASLPKEAGEPEVGTLFFVDNTIEKVTGTVQLGATFANERERLWPGQYVNVSLVLDVRKDALVVPSVAVQVGREGKFVFVVKPDETVEVRPVTVSLSAGTDSVVEKGLQAGERVVVDGQLRLVPGSRVEIKPGARPASASPEARS